MKITVLDFTCNSVDIITVDEAWLDNDLREALPEWYDDEEWEAKDESERIELFLFEYCDYSDSNIQYMIDCSEIRNRTPKDYA